jgi:hypothetical protein
LLPFPLFHFFCVEGAVSSMPTKVEQRTFSVVHSFLLLQSSIIESNSWHVVHRFPDDGEAFTGTQVMTHRWLTLLGSDVSI